MELLSRESVILSIHDSVGLLIEFTFIVKKCSRNSCHDMNLNFPFHAPGFYHSIVHVGLLSIKGMGNFTVELPDLTLPEVSSSS